MINHSLPANMLHLMGMAWKHYKIVFVLVLVQMIAGGLVPLFGLYLPVIAVELVLTGQELNQVLLPLGAFLGIFALVQIANTVAEQVKYSFQHQMLSVYHRLHFFKSMDCDFQLIESDTGQNRLQKARESLMRGDWSAPSRMFNAMAGAVSGGISFVFLIGILAVLNPVILVALAGLGILGYFIDRIPINFEAAQRDKEADIKKKLNYLQLTMSEISSGKDMRLYNLPPLFARLSHEILAKGFALRTLILNRRFGAGALNDVLGLVRDGLAYAYCIWQVTQGIISVPEFILFMGAITAFSGWLRKMADHMLILKQENIGINDLRGFLETTNTMNPQNPADISEIKQPVDIEFKNVSFRYTPDTPPVLDGLSFHIKANEKIALVGVNGAGKTTIVKLLCGFYKAGAGEILLSGININNFKRNDLYKMFSAVFQDIHILPMTAGENVSFKKPEQDEKITAALKTAGLFNDLEKTGGINTQMTKVMSENGVELSGGQQQKLTLARALYKDAPVMILDEPTAALDPIAESETYEKFHEVTGNKTALYISHRLASTRFCDRILLMKDGKITENGTHDALIARGGEYANMYEIQSHYYKEGAIANA